MPSKGVTPKLQREQVHAAIEANSGNLAAVARVLKVSRQTVYNFVNTHAETRKLLEQVRETMLDNVESVLYGRALAGESWAVSFFLRTQGYRRGYSERSQVENLNVDLSTLTVEQLERLAKGESVAAVIARPGEG